MASSASSSTPTRRPELLRKDADHDRQPPALARRRPLRGRVHLRHGCRQHPASVPPRHRRHPGGRDVRAALRAGGGGAAARRPLSRVRHAPDLLPARVVHRALPPGGGADRARWARGRPPPLPARARQRDVGARGTLLVRAKPGRDRRGDRPPAGGIPGGQLQVLPQYPRHPRRPRTRLRRVAVRRRHPLRARERPRLGDRAAEPLRPRRLAALPVLAGPRDDDADQVDDAGPCRVSRGVRRGLGVRRAVGLGVASVPERTPRARPCGQDPDRVHARQGAGLVRDPGGDCGAHPVPDRHRAWTPRVDRLPYYDGPIPELGRIEPRNVEP